MIDRSHIGITLPKSVLRVEAGRLQFFARTIGETNPIYFDEEAAQAAGFSSIPAPPTFIFATQLDDAPLERTLTRIGVDLSRILHGEQAFTYHAAVVAGDTITAEGRISDIYDKRDGALEFIVMDSTASNQRGATVAEMRSILVVRN